MKKIIFALAVSLLSLACSGAGDEFETTGSSKPQMESEEEGVVFEMSPGSGGVESSPIPSGGSGTKDQDLTTGGSETGGGGSVEVPCNTPNRLYVPNTFQWDPVKDGWECTSGDEECVTPVFLEWSQPTAIDQTGLLWSTYLLSVEATLTGTVKTLDGSWTAMREYELTGTPEIIIKLDPETLEVIEVSDKWQNLFGKESTESKLMGVLQELPQGSNVTLGVELDGAIWLNVFDSEAYCD